LLTKYFEDLCQTNFFCVFETWKKLQEGKIEKNQNSKNLFVLMISKAREKTRLDDKNTF